MQTARLLAATWLVIVGIIWLGFMYIFVTAMSSISTFVLPAWLALLSMYGPPIALIAACIFMFMRRYTRTAVVLASVACAWLTWMSIHDLWPSKPENDAIAPMQYDWIYFTELAFVVSADAAIVVLWRTTPASNQTLQPTAGRSDV